MIYSSGNEFTSDIAKRVCLIGMSGIGKTWTARKLRHENWYHYSVDYRIGTRYMGEHITAELRRLAARTPLFAELLRSDSMSLEAKLGIDNLAALSNYLGRPGNPESGGIDIIEYQRRQRQHALAERQATQDYSQFVRNAHLVYLYDNFVCDTSGSLCHIVDPEDHTDPVLTGLAHRCVLIHIESTDAQQRDLVNTFKRQPKPIYYSEEILANYWQSYLDERSVEAHQACPDEFAIWSYEKLVSKRQYLYSRIADRWAYTIQSEALLGVESADDIVELIARAIDDRADKDSLISLCRDSVQHNPEQEARMP